MFLTNPIKLQDLLNDAHKGNLQLPDFQRSFVWSDDEIQSLIASVAKGYPIGAFLSLETGGEVNFAPRLLEGVGGSLSSSSDQLLLDGQQRLTSLYQSLYSKNPVRTLNARGKEVDRFYYLDIPKAVSAVADVRDALIGVPADRILRKNFGREIDIDLSTPDKEFEHHAFPFDCVFEHMGWYRWIQAWKEYWKERGEDVSTLEEGLVKSIVEPITAYEIPVIKLDKKNGREAICLIFEKVNRGGQPLDTFELLTAIYAAESFKLRDDWNGPLDKSKPGRRERILGSPRVDVLGSVYSTDFLQACALLHTREERLAKERSGVEGRSLPQVSCNRDALLRLPLDAYKEFADSVEGGFREAASFLHEQKVISQRDIPYAPLLVGLAATFAILRREEHTVSAKDRDKIARWYWSVTLGEMYGSGTETLLARDVPELVKWITESDQKPRTLDDTIFQQDRLRSLRTRQSAAYKGIHALLMEYGCKDFVKGKPTQVMTFFNDEIDIHHVFPRAWCGKNGIPENDFNSIVNKTPLSRETNRAIGGAAPSVYLKRIEEKYGFSSEELDEILRTHLIEPEHLRNDDFYAFFNARIEALSDVISRAMDRPVVKEHGTNEEERDTDDPEDDDDIEEVNLIGLIRDGESDVMEFKSTLRTNLHTGQRDSRIEHAVLKTLAGFLNTNGGSLLIGVSDDGTPLGVEADGFPDEDKMNLHLVNIVNDRMGPSAWATIHANFDDYEDHRVMIMRCERSSSAVYLKNGNAEQFYIRTGPATAELSGAQLVDYIKHRFQ